MVYYGYTRHGGNSRASSGGLPSRKHIIFRPVPIRVSLCQRGQEGLRAPSLPSANPNPTVDNSAIERANA
jgi:hypothetical protein